MPASSATQTAATTTHAVPVSHAPSVASARPLRPPASRYDVVPLQAASRPNVVRHHGRGARRGSVLIVPPLQRRERRRVVVAQVALPPAVGETARVAAALRLDVRHDLPDL